MPETTTAWNGAWRRVMWRGSPFDQRTIDAFTEAERLAQTKDPTIRLSPTQGSGQPVTTFSAATHSGTGAGDLSVLNQPYTRAQEAIVIWALRLVGFAVWVRKELWRGSTRIWPRHIHALLMPPDLRTNTHGLHPSAMAQVLAYLDGGDALGGRDPHPRPAHIVSWETYQEEEEIPMDPKQFNKLMDGWAATPKAQALIGQAVMEYKIPTLAVKETQPNRKDPVRFIIAQAHRQANFAAQQDHK